MRRVSPNFGSKSRQAGFTLVETLISTSILTVAGTALLLGIAGSLQTTDFATEQTVAAGMAQQLLDEITGMRYCEAGASPLAASLGPDAGETSRAQFDDIDDYNGYAAQPPLDRFGRQLGSENGTGGDRPAVARASSGAFSNWRQEVVVHYAAEADFNQRLGTGVTSNYRTVHVRILVQDPVSGYREVCEMQRTFANIPGG